MVRYIKDKINNKSGFVSIFVVVIMSILIPVMFFITLDLPYYMKMNRTVKNTIDNAVSTAVVNLNEANLGQGNIVIDDVVAKRKVKEIVAKSFNLNDDLTINENSLLNNTPEIEIRIENNIPVDGKYINSENGKIFLKNPSVIATIKVPVEGKFFTQFSPVITHTSVAQAQFKK